MTENEFKDKLTAFGKRWWDRVSKVAAEHKTETVIIFVVGYFAGKLFG